LATILIAPFMSCSARLPVYALLIGTFFSAQAMGWSSGKAAGMQALIMLGCYALGVVAAVGTAWVFKRSFLKGAPAAFILELPTYKLPQLSQVVRQVWSNTKAFVTKAGTTIFCLSIILWAMSYYPRLPEKDAARIEARGRAAYAEARAQFEAQLALDNAHFAFHDVQPDPDEPNEKEMVDKPLAAAQLAHSISGHLGHALEPVFKPLGFDWKMNVGLVGAFAAREVFVSTMGIVYSVGEVKDEQTSSLWTAMRADKYANGKPVWTPLVAISLLVWFVLAMQCMSTVAIVRRETGGWRWPVFMILYMNGLAYVASLLVFQVGSMVFRT
jgi:ferrous iron transport protein B